MFSDCSFFMLKLYKEVMGCGGDQVGGDHGQSGVGIYVTAGAPLLATLHPHDWKLITGEGEGEDWPEGIERGKGGTWM